MYYNGIPEPPIEPPEDFFVEADCGHEVYDGDYLYEWEGRQLCGDCFREKVEEMTNQELALLLDTDYSMVRSPQELRREYGNF